MLGSLTLVMQDNTTQISRNLHLSLVEKSKGIMSKSTRKLRSLESEV